MTLEQGVFVIYMCILLGIGVYTSRRTSSLSDYLLGGRSIGPAATALTMQATSMSGYMFMGGPALTVTSGYFGFWYAIGDAGGSILNIGILGKRMRRLSEILGALTPIEYLEKRYESSAIRILGSIIAIVFISAYVFAQFIAAGKALSSLTGLSYSISLLIGVGVVLGYTIMGGYLAVVWTDFFQGIIMVLGMAGILFLALIKVGGFTGLHAKLAEVNPKLLSMWGTDPAYEGAWLVAIGAILLYAIGYMGLPHVVVRHMSMRNPQTAKGAIVWSALWNQFFIFAPYFLGLVAIILLPNLDDPEMVIPQLAHEVFPGFLAAIILSAIMAAVMSTADSQLIQAGSILSRDIYERFINPKATNRQMVIISRLLVFAIGIVGIIIAIYQPPTVFGLVIFAFGTLGSTFIVPYVAAVYSEKANKTGALAAMIAGAITCIIWTALNLEPVLKVHPFFAGLVASVIGMVIFNRFGTTPSQEVIEAVRKAKGIKGVRKPIEEGASLMLAPEAMAVAKHMKG